MLWFVYLLREEGVRASEYDATYRAKSMHQTQGGRHNLVTVTSPICPLMGNLPLHGNVKPAFLAPDVSHASLLYCVFLFLGLPGCQATIAPIYTVRRLNTFALRLRDSKSSVDGAKESPRYIVDPNKVTPYPTEHQKLCSKSG